jgi:hypothetical protein
MMNQPAQAREGARFRGLVIIWGGQVFSLALLFTMMQIIKPATPGEPNQSLLLVFAALVGFLLHFPRRRHIDNASGDQGQSFTTTL